MREPFGPDDLMRLRWATETVVAPGGDAVAVSIVEPDVDRDIRCQRWRILGRDGTELTRLPEGSRIPRWSPDGHILRWIVRRDERDAFVELDRADAGGIRELIDPVGMDVREMVIDPKGTTVALAGTVPGGPRFDPGLPDEPKTAHTPIVIDHAVFRGVGGELLPVTDWALMAGPLRGPLRRYPLPDGLWPDATEEAEGFELDWFPDGRGLAMSLSPAWDSGYELPGRHRDLFRLDIDTGTFERLTDDPRVARTPKVAPDGSLIAFLRQRGDPDAVVFLDEVCVLDLATRQVRSISEPHDWSFTTLAWFEDGRSLCVGAVHRGHARLARLRLDGSLELLAKDCGPELDLAAGTWAGVVASDPSTPGDPAIVDPDGTRTTVTDLDPWLADRRMAQTSEIVYPSAHPDRLEIHAMVARPSGAGEISDLPVVVDLHGGPYSSRGWWFDATREFFVGQGYVVIQPNYRGSDGFGQAFSQLSDRKHYPGWYDEPDAPHEMGLDVVGVIDAIREHGLGDPDRVFLRGVSAGAILTTWVLGRTDGFVAAVANSWYPGEWGAPMYGWYQLRRYFEGPPWDPEHTLDHLRRSPIMLVDKVKTPLLLIHGDRDYFTPQLEAEKYYHTLRGAGVDVALATFPDETHGIRNHPAGARNAALMEVAWFRRHDRDRTSTP